MKRTIFIVSAYIIAAAILLAGCGTNTVSNADSNTPAADSSSIDSSSIEASGSIEENTQQINDTEASVDSGTEEAVTSDLNSEKDASETPEQDSGTQEAEEAEETAPTEAPADKDPSMPDIVWLGDSLTQGSLGPDNGNENNPQAPWRILAQMSGANVDGWGLFGYNTHDILWVFSENDGIRDPAVTYIFWVGSNDFHDSPDNIGNVISEIDQFNNNAGITKYLVLGTTNRGDMEEGFHIPVNNAFAARYGDQYLDIMPYVEFGPDKVHLTEDSYRKVAEAVYDKLKSLGYL